MMCAEAQPILTEAARARGSRDFRRDEAERHARECRRCRRWAAAQKRLSGALGALAETARAASPDRERRLLTAYRLERRRRWRPKVYAGAAAALAVLLGAAWIARLAPPPTGESALAETTSPPPTPFLLLDYAALASPPDSGRLVQVTLPPTAPAYVGLPPLGPSAIGVRAEVLLGDDGSAQAVRFLEPIVTGGLD